MAFLVLGFVFVSSFDLDMGDFDDGDGDVAACFDGKGGGALCGGDIIDDAADDIIDDAVDDVEYCEEADPDLEWRLTPLPFLVMPAPSVDDRTARESLLYVSDVVDDTSSSLRPDLSDLFRECGRDDVEDTELVSS